MYIHIYIFLFLSLCGRLAGATFLGRTRYSPNRVNDRGFSISFLAQSKPRRRPNPGYRSRGLPLWPPSLVSHCGLPLAR